MSLTVTTTLPIHESHQTLNHTPHTHLPQIYTLNPPTHLQIVLIQQSSRPGPPHVQYLHPKCLGTQIGLGRGRQNERDLVMVKDPLTDFEEVVVGIWSLGSNPMARRDISSGSSRIRSLSKLRARWGLIPIEPTLAHTGV